MLRNGVWAVVVLSGLVFGAGVGPLIDRTLLNDNSTPQSLASVRDGQRHEALSLLSDALGHYRDTNGAYPSTGGQIQTLCRYPEDAGCALGSDLPTDPTGEGYWYVSDGLNFTLYAIRETDAVPECVEHPVFIEAVELQCMGGPQ